MWMSSSVVVSQREAEIIPSWGRGGERERGRVVCMYVHICLAMVCVCVCARALTTTEETIATMGLSLVIWNSSRQACVLHICT